jgi:hypothetical protein
MLPVYAKPKCGKSNGRKNEPRRKTPGGANCDLHHRVFRPNLLRPPAVVGTKFRLIGGRYNRRVMNDEKRDDDLSTAAPDIIASAIKSFVGMVPVAGPLFAEVVGLVIPQQKMDRIAAFAKCLESRFDKFEVQFIRSQFTNENFTDLVEESVRQGARAVSHDRREQIAELVANSLTTESVSFVESKHLLRILGEINDIEVIRLGGHLYEAFGEGEEYQEKHAHILEDALPTYGSSQAEIDKSTLQQSYDEHLAQLGLLKPMHNVDSKTNQLVVDKHTGEFEVRNYRLSDLGRLLLRQVGMNN